MYAHSFFVTSVRGIGFAPTTSASVALGVTGRMKAAFGFRVLVFFFAMQSPLKDARIASTGEYHETGLAARSADSNSGDN
jgi:hypothetical protein